MVSQNPKVMYFKIYLFETFPLKVILILIALQYQNHTIMEDITTIIFFLIGYLFLV